MKTQKKTILERFQQSMKKAFRPRAVEAQRPEAELAKVIMLKKRINGINTLEVLKEQTLQ